MYVVPLDCGLGNVKMNLLSFFCTGTLHAMYKYMYIHINFTCSRT